MSVAMDNHQPLHSSTSRPSQPHQRNRTLSFGQKSGKSGKSDKHSRKESHDEKQHLHPSTKADPNAAMNESQPIAAALEKPTLQSLRLFNHTDAQGNPIAEPDLSNPTRSRWERPLDTIRSFEAAIDNEYRRRAQTMRAGDANTEIMSGYASRRSSYYGGGADQNRYSQSQFSGYHGNRQSARDSWMDNGQNMGGPVGGPVGGQGRQRFNRMQSDPQWNRYNANGNGNGNGNSVYPTHGYHQSRDTVNTNGSGGSHSEPYASDPNSDNSSVERAPAVRQPDMAEQYGFNGFNSRPIMEEHAPNHNNSYFVQQSNGYNAPPPVPMKSSAPPPVPAHGKSIKLTKTNSNGGAPPAVGTPSRPSNDKRKSWFKRRFSKD